MNKQELIVSGPSQGRQGAIHSSLLASRETYRFPSTLEVDRYLYKWRIQILRRLLVGFRPLARQIGIYTMKDFKIGKQSFRFRPLSRQIGNYTPYLVYKPITSTRYNLLETTISISYFERVFISEYQINHILFLFLLNV